jgi:hypothetical protein
MGLGRRTAASAQVLRGNLFVINYAIALVGRQGADERVVMSR